MAKIVEEERMLVMKPQGVITAMLKNRDLRRRAVKALALYVLFFLAMSLAHAQEDFNPKLQVKAYWWFSQPTGFINVAGNGGSFDLQKDFGFGYYSTFSGAIDWRFKRRQHLLFGITPVNSTKTATLNRTITFRGNTYEVGTQATAGLNSLSFSPGYQFDFIHRNHGYLGLAAQMYILNTRGSITGTVTVNNQSSIVTSSASVLAPLPVIGPHAAWYPLHDSDRLSLFGFVQGMYFFGYGDFMSAHGAVSVKVINHLRIAGGYQMGTRLNVHGSSNTTGIRLTQKGPVAGLEVTW
jgi:hypothetical protein